MALIGCFLEGAPENSRADEIAVDSVRDLCFHSADVAAGGEVAIIVFGRVGFVWLGC